MATIKQKIAFKKVGENHGNVSKSMIEAGYSPASAKNPKVLTDSNGWQELMEKYLPDDHLGKRHRELLDKREVVKFFDHSTGANEIKILDQPDSFAVKAGLDMAYKLKARYKDTSNGNVFNAPVQIIIKKHGD